MARYKKTGTLDGFATIKAVARAAPSRPKTKPAKPPEPAPGAAERPTLQSLGAHVARTAIPTKQVIHCHACGYSFQLHGRTKEINCSKCRIILDLRDHVIDGPFTETLKTAGTIHIKPTGIVQDGELVAQDIVLEGTVEGGKLRAMRRLEIAAGAMFPERAITALDLAIGPGASVAFKQELEFRDVEIAGTLRARLKATGVVTIRAGGLLEGDLAGAHLVVDDGGGLRADVRIGE